MSNNINLAYVCIIKRKEDRNGNKVYERRGRRICKGLQYSCRECDETDGIL